MPPTSSQNDVTPLRNLSNHRTPKRPQNRCGICTDIMIPWVGCGQSGYNLPTISSCQKQPANQPPPLDRLCSQPLWFCVLFSVRPHGECWVAIGSQSQGRGLFFASLEGWVIELGSQGSCLHQCVGQVIEVKDAWLNPGWLVGWTPVRKEEHKKQSWLMKGKHMADWQIDRWTADF